MRLFLLIAIFMLSAAAVWAADPKSVVGFWHTEGNKAKVEIFPCGEKLCGKIVWLKDASITDPKEGTVGTPKLDNNNPVAELKRRPRLGILLMEGFLPSGENSWDRGTIYDPENGKTYKCKMKMTSQQSLEVRGFIGFSMLGRTSVWTR